MARGMRCPQQQHPCIGIQGIYELLHLHSLFIWWQSIKSGERRCLGALPDDVRQDDELDQPEGQSHLLVPHQHHPGGVILEEEGGHLLHELLPHGCARAVPQPPASPAARRAKGRAVPSATRATPLFAERRE